MSQTDFHPLTVSNVQEETLEAVTVSFELPDHLKPTFQFQAGQYLTLRFVIDGKDVRRAYSMSSSPIDDHISVSVKRVKGGLVSNHIADHIKAGTEIDVMPPQGRFLFEPQPDARRDIYLFGAGSGITPLMSILRTTLEREPKSNVYLLYGNRFPKSIMFHDQLKELQQRYQGQFFVTHTLSRVRRSKGLSSLWMKKRDAWDGPVGRIDGQKVREFLQQHPRSGSQALYYICGPNQLIDTVEQALLGAGIDQEYIFEERFVSANDAKQVATPVEGPDTASLRATIDGQQHEVVLKPGQTILDGLLEAKLSPPYSCLAGACSTCMAKVNKGGVRMEVCYALDEEEVEKGYVLTCQSYPTTEEVEIDYTV